MKLHLTRGTQPQFKVNDPCWTRPKMPYSQLMVIKRYSVKWL